MSAYENYDDAYDTDMADYEAWERSHSLIKNLIARLGEDAPLSLALGMAKMFEPLRPGSPRWNEHQAQREKDAK